MGKLKQVKSLQIIKTSLLSDRVEHTHIGNNEHKITYASGMLHEPVGMIPYASGMSFEAVGTIPYASGMLVEAVGMITYVAG